MAFASATWAGPHTGAGHHAVPRGAGELLRGKEPLGADNVIGTGDPGAVEGPGDAKVDDAGPGVGNDDVAGLEVTVHDAGGAGSTWVSRLAVSAEGVLVCQTICLLPLCRPAPGWRE
ncbi:hypothetical protein Srufu_069850 [Streptomyces libani subsp. rufus]|nr:hypothetical protein Srufu_069850 [Streptomyces libani subsp. rufus]